MFGPVSNLAVRPGIRRPQPALISRLGPTVPLHHDTGSLECARPIPPVVHGWTDRLRDRNPAATQQDRRQGGQIACADGNLLLRHATGLAERQPAGQWNPPCDTGSAT